MSQFRPYFNLPLAGALREYLDKHSMSQEDLADYLSIDARTLRRWKNGEAQVTNVYELKRIASLLGLPPEQFVILTTAPISLDQVDDTLKHLWDLLINEARYIETRSTVETLIRDLTQRITTEDHAFLYRLAHAHHIAGHVTSETSRTNTIHIPLHHYQEMEHVARILNDPTLLNIALTYQGDMHRRMWNRKQAVTLLEAARDTTPQADASARGNTEQLLARTYLETEDIPGFERSMAESARLSYEIDPATDSTHGLYSLGTVYEDYAKSYTLLGQMNNAMTYLDKAEKTLPSTGHWQTLLMTTRAMALVRGGEVDAGLQLALDATNLCYKHGEYRHLERVYLIQNYLDRLARRIGKAGSTLREALEGPIEYKGYQPL